jgi:hypothetical protein
MLALLPLMIIAAVAVAGLLADRLVGAHVADRGTYWTRVLLAAVPLLGLLLIGSWLLEMADAPPWHLGIHLMPDLLHRDALGAHALAAGLPVVIWCLILAGVAATGIHQPAAGRWLAGAIGLTPSRRWLLVFPVLSLLVLAAAAALRIGATEPDADYPVALWATLVVVIATLGFVALSRGAGASVAATQAAPLRRAPTAAPARADWPRALRERGIAPTLLYSAEAGADVDAARALPPPLAARNIPTALAQGLLENDDNRLVMAPDASGQLELIALFAERQVAERNASTLVIVPERPEELAAALRAWLPDEQSLAPLTADMQPDSPAFVWISDAKTLSDRLIPLLVANPPLLARIGSVVWWDVQRYSGVLAANFWAISHRFQRLLDRRAGDRLRHLAFVRGERRPDSQLSAFIDLCLPRKFPAKAQVGIDSHSARALTVHLLRNDNGQAPPIDSRPATEQVGGWRPVDTALDAARASLEAGWPTLLVTPAHLDEQVQEQFRREPAGGGTIAERLTTDQAEAGAMIMEVTEETLLALPEIVAQLGRAGPPDQPVHVGLVPAFGNPYVEWVLEQRAGLMRERKRRMVGAEPQPGVIQRHLLLALNELPATISGLNRTFRWERQGAIAQTLAELAKQNEILRRDVRYLVSEQEEDRLKVEVEYRSVLSRDRAPPLTTIGTELVDLFDPGEATIMRVDPERVTIDAYPLRVFMHAGRRYRVRQWESVESLLSGGRRIDCQREDQPVKTWRIFSPRLAETRAIAGRKELQIVGRGLTRTLVQTIYRERIGGRLEYRQDEHSGTWIPREHVRLPAPILSAPMRTRGLLLNVPRQAAERLPRGLHSLAQALRHVFPVHIGVDPDAVAILPFKGKPLDEAQAWGLMIVDLYPGGIGLIQSIDEDPALLVDLLALTRDWLAHCRCTQQPEAAGGCPNCLGSPIALSGVADHYTMELSRSEALELLEQVL